MDSGYCGFLRLKSNSNPPPGHTLNEVASAVAGARERLNAPANLEGRSGDAPRSGRLVPGGCTGPEGV